jgi:hypothetical protein
LVSTFVSIASTLANANTARSQAAETKRQAATMSGASARPEPQSADEEYWARIKAAGSGGYGT